MSKLYNPIFNRNKWGNFNKNKNFTALVSATGGYFLEDEINELQWIQNEARADILRTQFYSGLISKSNESDLIFQNENKFIPNLFSVDHMFTLINGHILNIYGNKGKKFTLEGNEYLNNIILPEPPENGFRDDFVYLEVSFREIKGTSKTVIWNNGNEDNIGMTIENDLVDPRINGETCRRIQIQWKIRTSKGVNFKLHPFGFDDKFKNGNVCAYGEGETLTKYCFWRSDLNLDGKNNFNDKGLWIAGNGEPNELGSIDGYVYAIPLFKVSRRNSSGYSLENTNGASKYDPDSINSSGRPDSKYCNIIYNDDIVDLRMINDMLNVNYKNILTRNFNKLLTGTLSNKNKIVKEYFGIDPCVPGELTKVYVPFNNDIFNKIDNNEPEIINDLTYRFVPGVQEDAISFNNNGYLKYEVNSENDIGRVSMMIKFSDINNKDLWSILDNNGNSILSCSLEEGLIKVFNSNETLVEEFIINTNIEFNKFCHIGVVWSIEKGYIYLIVNGKVIKTESIENKLVNKHISHFVIGYSDITKNFCTDVVIDDIEYSNELNVSFINLPVDFINGEASLCIDTQAGRRNYNKASSYSIITKTISVVSSSSGSVNISVNAPTGSVFSGNVIKLYQNNEATLLDVSWSGIGTNNLQGYVDNLGINIDYNFILNAEVMFDLDQGFGYKPQKLFRVTAEKSKKEFFPVRLDRKYEEYPMDRINHNIEWDKTLPLNRLFAYNPDTINNLGFGCAVKYYIKGQNDEYVTINKNLFEDEVIGIYSVSVFNKIDKSNIMKSFRYDENNIIIELNEIIKDEDILEIIVTLNKNICIYDHVSCGIKNMYKVHKLEFHGDGNTTKFNFSFPNRIMSSMGAIFSGEEKFIAIVDNVSTEINVEFKDNFVTLTFLTSPNNKSDIFIYINLEYDPFKSERLQVWYETPIYQGYEDINYVTKLNNSKIIYDLNGIFTITEGSTYIYEDGLNKNTINSTNLPVVNPIDEKLIATKILRDATNIKSNISYAKFNANDFNDNIPTLSELKLQLSNKNITRGYIGFISIDNKSLYSDILLEKVTPHLNILPILIKDNNDKLVMGILTTYDESNKVFINAEYEGSAFDIFELDENIIIK